MHRPVFVDDSGKRHRAARVVGATTGLLALVYLAVVAATFAGVPGLGTAPGLGELTNPAGAQADLGVDPLAQPVPELATEAEPSTSDTSVAATSTTTTTRPTPTTTSPGTATTSPETTTTTTRGQGNTPNSTVPDHGPPTSKPR